MKTTRTKVVAIIVAAAILLAAAVTTVIVLLTSDGLDNLKNKSFSDSRTYDGVEILEKDGLFYLTRDGKKLSKTGYTSLVNVNSFYDSASTDELLAADDFEIYDYFLARKSDADTYLLVNTSGKEIAIEGSDLVYDGNYLPFIKFKSSLTGKYGAISLKELDSSLSSNAGEEISVNMFDELEFTTTGSYSLQYDTVCAKKTAPSAVPSTSYIYLNDIGTTLFVSPNRLASVSQIKSSSVNSVYYYLTDDSKLYRADGTLVASDVQSLVSDSEGNRWLAAYCTPENSALSAEENAELAFYKVFSTLTDYEVKASDYIISSPDTCINQSMLVAGLKEQDSAVQRFIFFSLLDGSTASGYTAMTVSSPTPSGLMMATGEENNEFTYHYFDLKTGKRILVSKYNDMTWAVEGSVLTSQAEKLANNIEFMAANPTATELPSGYAHFVKPFEDEKVVTLAAGQSVEKIFTDDSIHIYKISTVKTEKIDDESTLEYTASSEYVYLPFSDEKSASYDTIQAVEVFNKSVGIGIGTDYVAGRFDFIDLTNGKAVHSVSAAGAEIARTTISHLGTYVLAADGASNESAVEFAAFAVQKKNESGEVEVTEYLTLSRGTALSISGADGDDYITSPLKVKADYGKDLYTDRDYDESEISNNSPFAASTFKTYAYGQYYTVNSYSKYLTVTTSKWSTDVYAINQALELEKLSTIPSEVVRQVRYGNALDDVHLVVRNDSGEYGLYAPDGNQILAPVYDYIDTFGEYIIVQRQNAYGMFKYNAEKGKTKQVLECRYTYYEHIADNLFELSDNTSQSFLYDGKELVKKDALTGYSVGVNFSYDKETGCLQYNSYVAANIDGTFYLYRGDAENAAFSTFLSGVYYIANVEQPEAKVVNLRESDGTLIESTVVYGSRYANHKSYVEFTLPADTNWYASGVKDEQIIPIDKSYIFATSDNTVNFYKAPAESIIG